VPQKIEPIKFFQLLFLKKTEFFKNPNKLGLIKNKLKTGINL